MKLSSFLNSKFILIGDKFPSKDKIIEKLIDKIASEYSFEFNKDLALKALKEREALGETFIEGVLIPHARLENFNDLLIGVYIPQSKSIFSNSGEEVKILFLIFAPKTSSNLYLNLLAAISNISQQKELFESIINSKSSHEFIEKIDKANIRVKKSLTVEDIMTKDVVKVDRNSSIKEVINLFRIKHTICGIVVDENDNLKGIISINEILSKGMPEYTTMLDNLSFMSELEPLEELLEKEDQIKVEELTKKISVTLSSDDPFVEGIHKLIKNKLFAIPVLDKNGKPVGILSEMDILNKVLRA